VVVVGDHGWSCRLGAGVDAPGNEEVEAVLHAYQGLGPALLCKG
jgi:hypothetical protein